MEILRLGKKNDLHPLDKFLKQSTKNFCNIRSESQVKYKTELCRNWESGFCEFGDKCYFAHSLGEIRDKSQVSSLKHLKCKIFFELGYCLHGSKCQYSHKDVFPETAESSPSVSNKTSRKASRDIVRAPNFIDLETRRYN